MIAFVMNVKNIIRKRTAKQPVVEQCVPQDPTLISFAGFYNRAILNSLQENNDQRLIGVTIPQNTKRLDQKSAEKILEASNDFVFYTKPILPTHDGLYAAKRDSKTGVEIPMSGIPVGSIYKPNDREYRRVDPVGDFSRDHLKFVLGQISLNTQTDPGSVIPESPNSSQYPSGVLFRQSNNIPRSLLN